MVPLGVVLCYWCWRFASAGARRGGGMGMVREANEDRWMSWQLERVWCSYHGYIGLGVVFNGVLTSPPRKTSKSTDHWHSPIN